MQAIDSGEPPDDLPKRRTIGVYDHRSKAERQAKPKKRKQKKPKPLPRFGKNVPIPTHLLTASVFMQVGGISWSEFRKLTYGGHVRAVALTPHLRRLYDRADIDRVNMMRDADTGKLPFQKKMWTPSAYTVEEAERVFGMIAEGVSLDRIMLETRIHPVKLAAIREQYAEFSGGVWLPRSVVDFLNGLPVDGATFPLRTGEEIAAFVKLALREGLCAYCRQAPRSVRCVACTRSALRRQEDRERPQPPDLRPQEEDDEG